jgi:hypothetical protein
MCHASTMRSRPLSLLPELRHRRLRLVWGLKRWRAFQASPLGSLQAKSNGESGSPGSVITASGAEAAVLVQGLPTVYLTKMAVVDLIVGDVPLFEVAK